MYSKITNPITGRTVAINGKLGKTILRNYINILMGGGRGQIPIPDKPIFLIVAGATGSGKGGIPSLLLSQVTNPLTATASSWMNANGTRTEWVKALVDDLVEHDPYYKHRLDNILKGRQLCGSTDLVTPNNQSNNCKDTRSIKKLIDNIQPETYDAFGDAYFSTRTEMGCKKFMDAAKPSCDTINDIELTTAIIDKRNIVFETTNPRASWLFDPASIEPAALKILTEDYHIILTFSMVDYTKLRERNKSRASEVIYNYLHTGRPAPYPRLPDVSVEGGFKNKYASIKKNLQKEISAILNINSTAPQPTSDPAHVTNYYNHINTIILYNNNGAPGSMNQVVNWTKTSVKGLSGNYTNKLGDLLKAVRRYMTIASRSPLARAVKNPWR